MAAGIDLIQHGTTSSAEVIQDTAIAQPLLVATALISYDAWRQANPEARIKAVAGHSVGEFAAAAVAGVFSQTDAVGLVAVRGRAMAACAKTEPTGMAAVIGGQADQVLEAIEQAGAQVANFNGPAQVVAGGSIQALDRLAATPPARARVIRLDVAGAFHTSYMEPAKAELAAAIARLDLQDATYPLITNGDGTAQTAAAGIGQVLVDQVTRPVRWDLVQQTILALGPTRTLELAPAGVLAGLAKRGMKGVKVTGLAASDFVPPQPQPPATSRAANSPTSTTAETL